MQKRVVASQKKRELTFVSFLAKFITQHPSFPFSFPPSRIELTKIQADKDSCEQGDKMFTNRIRLRNRQNSERIKEITIETLRLHQSIPRDRPSTSGPSLALLLPPFAKIATRQINPHHETAIITRPRRLREQRHGRPKPHQEQSQGPKATRTQST